MSMQHTLASAQRASGCLLSGNPLRIWSVCAPLVLAVVWWWSQALYGFNPTDDGFILGQAWRVLQGEIPHTDFTSPRPVGSALLHLPEALAPFGMLAISRLVVTLQLLWIATAAVEFVTRTRWSPTALQKFLLIAIAFIVNICLWPIMAWHTIDGLFIGITALWLTTHQSTSRHQERSQWILVWTLAGIAPLMKQGFILVPVLVALVVAVKKRHSAWLLSPLAAAPGFLYLVWVGPENLTQIYSGSSGELLLPFILMLAVAQSPAGLLALGGVTLAFLLVTVSPGSRTVNRVLAGALVVGPTLLTAHQDFGVSSSWALVATLTLILTTVLSVRTADLAMTITALLGLGLAVSISWGVPGPGLLAGSFLVTALLVLWHTPPPAEDVDSPAESLAFAFLLVVVLLVSLLTSVGARNEITHAERPRSDLVDTFAHPNFALVKMSLQSATYLRAFQACLVKYPAQKAAVLPDNPGLYPLFGLNNPLPSDWWLPAERASDHARRLAEAVESLNKESNWLILFQSFGALTLSQKTPEEISSTGSPFAYVESDVSLLDDLIGQTVRCSSLQGKYRPGS